MTERILLGKSYKGDPHAAMEELIESIAANGCKVRGFIFILEGPKGELGMGTNIPMVPREFAEAIADAAHDAVLHPYKHNGGLVKP